MAAWSTLQEDPEEGSLAADPPSEPADKLARAEQNVQAKRRRLMGEKQGDAEPPKKQKAGPRVRTGLLKAQKASKKDEAEAVGAKAKASSSATPGQAAPQKKVLPKLAEVLKAKASALMAKSKANEAKAATGAPSKARPSRSGRAAAAATEAAAEAEEAPVESSSAADETEPQVPVPTAEEEREAFRKRRRKSAKSKDNGQHSTTDCAKTHIETDDSNAPEQLGGAAEMRSPSELPDTKGEADPVLKSSLKLPRSRRAEQSEAAVKMEAPQDIAGTDQPPSVAATSASPSGTEGAEVSSKAKTEAVSAGSKAKTPHKSPDGEAAPKTSKAGSRLLGAAPTVLLARGLPEPPRGLLPEDAVLAKVKPKKGPQLLARCHSKVVAEAEKAGFQATGPWQGLGEVPEILKGGFRSLVILGPSGSGKSTLLRALLNELFPNYDGPLYPGGEWPPGRAVIEAFDTAHRGRDLLGSVGLSSVPSWCKPFEVLSVGEKYRANIALALQQRGREPGLPVVFDEWTSELDRGLARVVSVALGKRLRQEAARAAEKEAKATTEDGCGHDGIQGHRQDGEEEEEAFPRGPGEVEGEEEDFPRNAPESQAECAEDEAEFEEPGEEEDGPVASELEGCPEVDWPRRSRTESTDGMDDEEGAASDLGDLAEQGEDAGAGAAAGELCAALPGGAGAEAAKDCGEGAQPGPFIFATCHEDVVAYLQPEFVCLCAVGEAPRVFRNEHMGGGLVLRSELHGDLEPLPVHRGCHMLVGHWMVKTQDIQPFMINYNRTKAHDIFRLMYEGGKKMAILRRSTDPYPKNSPSAWYSSGTSLPEHGELRLRVVNERTLCMQQRKDPLGPWSKEVRAARRSLPQPVQALMLTKDPESVAFATAVMNYGDFAEDVLKSHGWYLPPELAPDGRYAGLRRSKEPQLVSITDFKFDAKLEKLDDYQHFLATYVGEPEGGLSAKLQAVSRLLDCPFDGLCMHKIPQLPPLGDFCIGVITGPSGSGKSTLAQHLFGPSPTVTWSQEAPVLAHFASLASARELCGAAGLDLASAMRPYGILSSGEQSRADLARILQKAAASADTETSAGAQGQAWVLDEFTSKVDRPMARRMARGLQRFAQRRGLRRLVVVSCHDDFVGSGLLEPDWLFESRNGRLLHFDPREEAEVAMEEEPFRLKLLSAKASLSEAESEIELLNKRLADASAATCFSKTFKTELAIMSKALASFCEEELLRQRTEVDAADAATGHARKAAVERFYAEQAAADEEFEKQGAKAPEAEAEAEAPEARLPRLLEPPALQLEVRRALPREWVHFREHHYKDHSLHTAAVTYVGLIGNRAACFLAMVQESSNWVQKHARNSGKSVEWANMGYPKTWAKSNLRRLYREHRTVVLPDFQGMGLAPLLCDSVALHVLETGHDFTSQTVHPFYGGYRDRSPFWRALPSNRKEWTRVHGNYKFSHVFVGAVRPSGHTDLALAAQLERRIGRRTMRAVRQPS